MVFSASLEGTFVFEVVALIRAGFRVDVIDGFAFLEEHAFDADVRFQLHNVVINEAPFANGLSVLVAERHVGEVSLRVCGRRRGQADL